MSSADLRIPLSIALADIWAVTRRNVLTITRVPVTIVFTAVQPVIFVLMFRYVFGGAIGASQPGYIDYLMCGIFTQTVVFGSVQTAIGIGADLQVGLIERFRSLPMARSAVLVGRLAADTLRNLFVVSLMVAIGFAVGFRVHTDAAHLVAAVGVLLLFGIAMSAIMACVGMATKDPESAQAASFPLMAILVFPSNAFVPTSTMPDWLRVYADHQPVSAVTSSVRALVLGGPTTSKLVIALAWIIGIAVVFAALAIRQYRRVA